MTLMSPDAVAVLSAYDAQMRARIPARSSLAGMVFETEGPVLRTAAARNPASKCIRAGQR